MKSSERYSQFALCREMLQTGDIVTRLDLNAISAFASRLTGPSVMLTGEGSSRIFPAKKTIRDARALGYKSSIMTEAATQALEYDLSSSSVCVASNSGKTKECVRLIRHLRSKGHGSIVGLVAAKGSPVEQEADASYVLTCGGEDAVAATKSVMEQALFYDVLFRAANGKPLPDLRRLGSLITETLVAPIPKEIVQAATGASMLYWAGRNDGVAEELTLKSNEIARRKSDFLEGTYAVHGIEEVMDPSDLIIVVDPFPEEEDKFAQVLVKGVGAKVVAISSRKTSFPTFLIPSCDGFSPYLQLAAGWNLLVEVGVGCGINLDKPQRARKVGNEFPG